MMLHYFANPNRFMRFSNKMFPYITTFSIVLVVLGLWYGLINSPPDYLQGESVRIMYIHVPSAWLSLFSIWKSLSSSSGSGRSVIDPRLLIFDCAASVAAPVLLVDCAVFCVSYSCV